MRERLGSLVGRQTRSAPFRNSGDRPPSLPGLYGRLVVYLQTRVIYHHLLIVICIRFRDQVSRGEGGEEELTSSQIVGFELELSQVLRWITRALPGSAKEGVPQGP